MASIRLPYLQVFRKRGRVFAYYRRGPAKIRLPGEVGSPEFLAAYAAAHQSYVEEPPRKAGDPPPRSMGALIRAYRQSAAWASLALATRADYEKGLRLLEPHAHRPAATLDRPAVIALREAASWSGTGADRILIPSRANKMLAVLSILMELACDLGWRKHNPALGVAKVARPGDGYRPWTADEIDQFEAWATEYAPFWRRALIVALYTGQCGQDQVAITRAAYQEGEIRVQQEKTGAEVTIPAHPRLIAELAEPLPGIASLTHLLHRTNGTAWPVNALQKAAGQAIRDAGLSGVVWHGLRSSAASFLAECGCPDAEIMAIIGYSTERMVKHYRRGADQKRLARQAIGRLQIPQKGRKDG